MLQQRRWHHRGVVGSTSDFLLRVVTAIVMSCGRQLVLGQQGLSLFMEALHISAASNGILGEGAPPAVKTACEGTLQVSLRHGGSLLY
jgi:hypothetical protein